MHVRSPTKGVNLAGAYMNDPARGKFQALKIDVVIPHTSCSEEQVVEVGPSGTMEVPLGNPQPELSHGHDLEAEAWPIGVVIADASDE